MPAKPVSVVTGANRGLGREVCRQLAARGHHVVLTARDPAAGRAAAGELGVDFLPLDVRDPASVERFAARLRDGYPEGVAALVCNAGIAMDGFDADVAETTVDVNFFGTVRVVHAVLPQLTNNACVALVSSGSGDRGRLSPELRAAVSAPDLTLERLSAFMGRFVADVRAGRHTEEGWPSSAYAVSKIGVTALAGVLARDLAGDPRRPRINAVCPGWVRTDMGGPHADRDVSEGAASIVWAATLPPDGPSGGFFRDGRPADW
jgi:NAD(P)-dependent dehydrogenase (short-subunit alcohol dehydrogenase family)